MGGPIMLRYYQDRGGNGSGSGGVPYDNWHMRCPSDRVWEGHDRSSDRGTQSTDLSCDFDSDVTRHQRDNQFHKVALFGIFAEKNRRKYVIGECPQSPLDNVQKYPLSHNQKCMNFLNQSSGMAFFGDEFDLPFPDV
jgi:hypothetical protein